MPSNGALIPIHHTDMDESTALNGNDGPFSAKRTNFLQYSLGNDETFMSDEYMRAYEATMHARAPLLHSHTMDGSSNYSGQEYEATMHARAPLLHSHTMDGSSNISAENEYRAPVPASHTMDGSSSYQNYEASEQAIIPSREYAVDRRQSVPNEEMTALYGNPQTIQTLASGNYR
jgi:hypothetical protein